MPSVKAGEVNLYYCQKGKGFPFVLIHGWGSNHKIWTELMNFLSRSFCVIAPDLRGHGRSSFPPGAYSIKILAEDINALFEALNLSQVYLMGLSMGSAVALQMAWNHPQKIRSLILASAWSYCDDDFKSRLQEWISIIQNGGIQKLTEYLAAHYFPHSFIMKKPQLGKKYKEIRSEQSPQSVISACQACLEFDMRKNLRSIKIPTLLISGEFGVLAPPHHAKYIAQQIPRAKSIILKGGGHLPFWDKPNEFCEELLEFIRSLKLPGKK